MPNPGNLLAAFGAVMLAACRAQEHAPVDNGGVEAEPAAPANRAAADPKPAATSADRVVDPVPPPPPDAVSHPEGYLPPAPGQPEPTGSNALPADKPAPATEDEYIRDER